MRMTAGDVRQYYSSCYGHHDGEIVKVLDVIGGRDNTDAICSVQPVGNKGREEVLFKNISFSIPHSGFTNIDDYLFYVDRNPARQYKKGFNLRTVNARSPVQSELAYLGRRPCSLDTKKFLTSFFDRKYPSFEKALEDVTNCSKLGEAFTLNHALVIKAHYEKPFIMKRGLLVAQVDEHGFYLPKKMEYLTEELQRVTGMERVA